MTLRERVARTISHALVERCVTEAVNRLDHVSVYSEARRRTMSDATMQGYDFHATRVVAEMSAQAIIPLILEEAAKVAETWEPQRYDDTEIVAIDIATAIRKLGSEDA